MPEAGQILEKMGNLETEKLLGLVVSNLPDDEFVVLSYEEEVFVKDDEEVEPDDILEEIQDGEHDCNEAREEKKALVLFAIAAVVLVKKFFGKKPAAEPSATEPPAS